MEVTKPYELIGFGALEVTKPYELIGFGWHRDGGLSGSRAEPSGAPCTEPGSPRHRARELELPDVVLCLLCFVLLCCFVCFCFLYVFACFLFCVFCFVFV